MKASKTHLGRTHGHSQGIWERDVSLARHYMLLKKKEAAEKSRILQTVRE